MGIFASTGAILGSTFGPQLFKTQSIFSMTIFAIFLSIATSIAALCANIFFILPIYFLLSAITSIASLKMQQWIVTTIDRKILASSVGLLNTILMVVAPVMTTALTTVSGLKNVKYSLIILLAIESIILFVSFKMAFNTKQKVNKSAIIND